MGYTPVRKCIHIEINRRFNLIHEKECTGDTISNICKRYGLSTAKEFLLGGVSTKLYIMPGATEIADGKIEREDLTSQNSTNKE